MAFITWRVFVDFDYQGIGTTPDYTALSDDITSYVKGYDTSSGGDFNEVRPDITVGKCSIRLDNRTKAFNLNDPTAKFYGKLRTGLAIKVEITTVDTGLKRTWFEGIIEMISPDSGLFSNREVSLQCADFLSVLQSSLVDLPLIKNIRSSTLIRHILNTCFNAPKAKKQVDIISNPANGQYIEVDGKRITFVTSLTGDNQVVIGATLYETLDRLKAAINGDQGAGSTYSLNVDRSSYIVAGHTADFYRIAKDNEAIRLYMINETVGSSAADLGSNNKAATYVGAYSLGLVGVGYPAVTDLATNLGGVSGYLSIPPMDMNRRQFSVGFWARLHTTIANSYLFDIRGGSGGNWSIRMDNTGKVYVQIDGVDLVNSGTTLLTIGSHYITVTQTYFAIKLYINGVLVGSVTTSTMFDDPTTTSFSFGSKNSGASNFLSAVVEKFHLHFLELTQGAITALYSSRYTSQGVVLTYRIPGAIGNTALLNKSAKTRPTPIRSPLDSVIANDLPVLWFAQEESTGTTAFSKGSNGNSATYNSVTLAQPSLVAGEDGYSVSYDGISGYLQLPSITTLNGASYTFEMMIAPTSLSANFDVFHIWVNALSGQSILLRLYSDTHMELDYAGGGTVVTGATGIVTGVPLHIMVRHDVSTGKSSIWVYGTKLAEASTSGFTTASTPLSRFMWSYVGTRLPGRGQHFVYYNRALADAEILEHGQAATTATLLGGVDYPADATIQQGLATFEIAADQWSPLTTNGLTAITNVATSEVGRFYLKRDGKFFFENRDSRFYKAISPPTLVLNNQPEVLASVNRSDIFSSMSVTVTPRDLSETIGVVAIANDLITVPGRTQSQPILPGGKDRYRISSFDTNNDYLASGVTPTVIELQYLDPVTKRKIGVHQLQKPLIAGVDWTANEFKDFTGVDYTFYSPLQLDFTLIDQGSSVKVYLSNKALGALYVNLQVRGYKVTYYDPITVTKDNPLLITGKSLRNAQAINIPLGGNNIFANLYASYLINLYSVDRLYIKELDFGAQLKIGNFDLLSLEVGQVLKVTETQVGITNELYEITGVSLTVEAGGDGYDTRPQTGLKVKVRRLDDMTFGLYDNFTNVDNTLYDKAYYTF